MYLLLCVSVLYTHFNTAYGTCADANGTLNLSDDVILDNHYAHCSDLITLNLLPGVKQINEYAFANCKNLETVSMATSVSSVGSNAFFNCTSLKNINVPFRSKVSNDAFLMIGCSDTTTLEIYTPGRKWENCTSVTQFNYNSNLFFPGSNNMSCEELCYQNMYCQGYIESLENIVPYQCFITMPSINIDVAQNLNEIKENFTGFHPLNCSAYTAQDVCFSVTKTCISCPEFPTAWQNEVESGYTIHFLSTCCSDYYHDQFTETKTIPTVYNTNFKIGVNNLKFVSHPNILIQNTQCPMFIVDTPNGIDNIEFSTMSIECTNASAQSSAILVEYTRSIAISAEDMSFKDVLSGITVLGGSQNDQTIIPSFSVTDLSNSVFSNLNISSDINPAVSALSLASYTGENIKLNQFTSNPLIVIQPGINDDNSAPVFTPNPPLNVRIFNISLFTQIFGVEYEISFSHAGAFSTDEEAVSLRRLIVYQAYIMIALLSLLLLLHQDLLYYYKENAGANRKIEKEIEG